MMETIEFNKHDINIFINDVGDSLKLQGNLNLAFDQRESEVNLQKVTPLPETPSNTIPASHI